MNSTLKNKTSQFLLFQNKAYHEDNLINSKPLLDTKMKDYSYIFDSQIPSKKSFLERERNRNIENGNSKLLNRIYSIIYDKDRKIAKKYRPEHAETKFFSTKISFHPFSEEHRAKTLNFGQRKRENVKIFQDNLFLLNRLKNSKPRVLNVDDVKKHSTRSNKYAENIRVFDTKNRPRSVLTIFDRQKLNPTLDQFIQRHEKTKMSDTNLSLTHNHESVNVSSMLNDRPESGYVRGHFRGRSAKVQSDYNSTLYTNQSFIHQDQTPMSNFRSFIEVKKQNLNNLKERDIDLQIKQRFAQFNGNDRDNNIRGPIFGKYKKNSENFITNEEITSNNNTENYPVTSNIQKDSINDANENELNDELFKNENMEEIYEGSYNLKRNENQILIQENYNDHNTSIIDDELNKEVKNLEESFILEKH